MVREEVRGRGIGKVKGMGMGLGMETADALWEGQTLLKTGVLTDTQTHTHTDTRK